MSGISKKNQVTIPVAALADAGLRPGDDLRVIVEAPGRLLLVRVDDLIQEFAGMFDETIYPSGYLQDLRRAWR